MTDYLDRAGLGVAPELAAFVETQVLPGLGIAADGFWAGVADVFGRFAPENRALLARRDALQSQIDEWYRERRGQANDPVATGLKQSSAARETVGEQEAFLREIGYLVDEPAPFAITTENVDPELATLAGPQLVVPILNARFLLNAANARWGSLYDALYGTDALGVAPVSGPYDAARGAKVVARAKAFLDEAVPLAQGSWADLADVSNGIAIRDPGQYVGKTDR